MGYDFAYDAAWTHYERDSLRRRYGAGTFVAVIDAAVIDWGTDEKEVRERAESLMGEPVYVGSVSAEPGPDYSSDEAAATAEWQAYKAARNGRSDRRRFPMAIALDIIDELRLIGAKTEYYGGCFMDNGEERRFSDHDYRLLVEHGAIPKDTILVAGIVFWEKRKLS